MGLLSYFKKNKKSSASQAKERLQILIAHERNGRGSTPDYLPRLKSELMTVIRKYVDVTEKDVNVQYEEGSHCDVLELNIVLPENKYKF